MNTRVQAYNIAPTGGNSVDVYEDISTRTLNTVRIGQSAGKINSGSFNVYAGYQSGANALNSSYTTAIGYNAMFASTNALYCTAIGAFAAAQNQSGSENVYVGYKCGEFANYGNQSVAVGAYSMNHNVAANSSVAIGYRSAERTLDGGFCVFIGAQAGQDNRNSLYSTLAGYQSGRASRGDNNCLFGAYSGYSNINGNGSCLFGFRSGENTSGDFNCAFGAFSMQYASGSSNVAIGAFANSSGSNSTESVFVGTNVAASGSASQSVILGTNAGATASGSGLVILGFNAGSGFLYGNCNILIGQGASTFKPINNNGISIGSINTLTYTNSISIGNDIINLNEYSIMLGHNLRCDANQSILVGNNNNVLSVELFQDPLSFLYTNSVLQDGANKIGIQSINYCNILKSPSPANTIYTIGQASIYVSNIVNSEINPPDDGIVSSSYNLLTSIPSIVSNGYAIIIGQCFPIKNSIDTLSNVSLYTYPYTSNITPVFNGLSSIYLNDYIFIDSIYNTFTFSAPFNNVTVNIRTSNISNTNAFIYLPKTVAPPVLNNYIDYNSNITIYAAPLQLIASNTPIYLDTSRVSITYNPSHGLVLPPNTINDSYSVSKYSKYGKINATGNENYIYTPYYESTFAKNDSIQFISVLNITSNTGLGLNCAYGLPSSNTATFDIVYNYKEGNLINDIYTANKLLLPYVSTPYYLNNQTIQSIANYNSYNSNIVISHIGSNMSLYYVPTGQTYTSTQITEMSNASIWNYTNKSYSSHLQNILYNIDACIVSNSQSNTTILEPLISDMNVQIIPYMSNIVIIDNNPAETQAYNNVYNALIGFNTNHTPYTLNVLSNSFMNLVQINTDLLQSVYFQNFNNDLTNYVDIYIGKQFYYMNSNIINTSNIITNNIITNNITTLQYIYTYSSNAAYTYTYYQDALYINNSITILYNNYYIVPRLFLSYADFNSNNIVLTNTSNTISSDTYLELVIAEPLATTPVSTTPMSTTSKKHIEFITGTNTTWNTLYAGFTCNIYTSNTVLQPIILDIPVSSTTNLIVQTLPASGIISKTAGSGSTSATTYTYLPRNPWALNDNFNLIVTSNSESVFVPYVFNNDASVRIQSPLYIQTPLSYSNITDVYNTIYTISNTITHACNIDIISSYKIDGITQSDLLNTIYTPILDYKDLEGISIKTSNVTVTNDIKNLNLDVSSIDGSLILTSNLFYRYTTDLINYETQLTSNINTYIWSNANPLNYPVLSNQNVYYTTTTCNIVYNQIKKLYNTTSTYVKTYVYNSSYYDSINNIFIYNDVSSNNNPNSNSVYILTSNIPTDGLITQTSSNIIINNNISYYESYMKLNTNYIWTPQSQYIFSVSNYGPTRSTRPIVYQNIGPVTSFTMQNVMDGYVYIHTSNYTNTSTSSALNNFNIQLNNLSALQIRPINTPVIPITYLTNPTFTTLNISPSTSLAPLNTLIQHALSFVVNFTAAYIHVYSLNTGYGSMVLTSTTNPNSVSLVNTVLLSQLNNIYYLASHKYETDTFGFFFSDTNNIQTSQLFYVNLNINQVPVTYIQSGSGSGSGSDTVICGQGWNSGLNYNNTYFISSNALYNSFNGINASNIIYTVTNTNLPSWLSIPNSFTQQDINKSQVPIQIIYSPNKNTIMNDTITYSIVNGTYGGAGETLATNITFPIASYYFNNYPNAKSVINSSLQMYGIDDNNLSYYNILSGDLWNIIKNLYVNNSPIDPTTIKIIIKSLRNGFLWSTNSTTRTNPNIYTTFTLDYLLNNTIIYIPFDPNINNLINDTLVFNITYIDGSLSPVYTIPLKPYIFRFYQSEIINTGVQSLYTRTIQQPIYSKASSNSVQWVLNGSNSLKQTCLYNSNIYVSWSLLDIPTGVQKLSYVQTITTKSYSTPISIINNAHTLTVDQSDSVSLKQVLANINFNSNMIYDCYVYILTNPLYGIIQDITTGNNIIRCSIEDINNNKIVYQNFGSAEIIDTFIIGVSSTPYDLAQETINVQIQINRLPIITKNTTSFIYFSNSNSALTSNIIIPNTDLNITNNSIYTNKDSYIHIINSCNINLVKQTYLNNVNYTINSNVINYGSPYDLMSFNYTVNNTSNVNPISLIAPYNTLFINNHNIRLNTHIDSNIILPGQNDRQSIVYSISSNTAKLINKNDHTVTITVDVWPQPSLQNEQTNFLHKHNFNINISDSNNNSLLFVDFHKDRIIVNDIHSDSTIITLAPSQQLLETTWNTITLINIDPLNDYGLSLTWYDGTNLLAGSSLSPIINTSIANISINVDTLNLENYIGYSNFNVQSLTSNYSDNSSGISSINSISGVSGSSGSSTLYDGTMGASFMLYNYYTKHKLKNFQIFVSTYNVNTDKTLDTTVNNVILGNKLTVRGVNNICIGDTFTTSGTNSIIIGNQIGSITTGDIYQSIVIGNSCFQNSTLRDIICIGRNNLNNLSINENPIKIQNFISQFPIILGNNINSSMIDFYINIDNTFLKSSTVNATGVKESQVYIGFSKEPVGIGYTCNVNLTQDYALNVNGSILATNLLAPVCMLGMSENVIIPSGYLVSSTGNMDVNGNVLVKMAGIIGGFDNCVVGLSSGSNSVGETIIRVSGASYVWCDSIVSCGQYLVCSSNNLGIASATTSSVKNNYIFGKSLVNWDPLNTALYPNIVTKIINNNVFGKIYALLNI